MNTQIKALLRKELRISRRNIKGTACEMLIPLIIGAACSLLIYVNDDVLSKIRADPLKGKPVVTNDWESWIGIVNNSNPLTGTALGAFEQLAISASQGDENATVGQYFTTQDALQSYVTRKRDFTGKLIVGYNASGSVLDLWLSAKSQKSTNLTNAAAMFWALANLSSSTNSVFVTQPSSINYHILICMTASMFILIAYLPNTIITAGRMVEEKVNKVKELLKVMGLRDRSYFLSHFLAALCRMLPGVFFMSITTCAFGAVSWGHLPTFFFSSCLFSVSTTAFAFLMPVFFSKAVWSNVSCVAFLYVLAFMASTITSAPGSVQQMACIASPVSMFFVVIHIFAGNAFSSTVSLEFAIGMIAFDSVLYFLLGAYLIQVFPGEFGIPKHPLFFLGFKNEESSGEDDDALKRQRPKSALNQTFTDTEERICFTGLIKRYGNAEVAAVNELNMRIKKGEIFCLLGHNGAGKTTTISMLTGLVPATSYECATVDGRDIGCEMDAIRQTLGVCPQFDVLFGDLTAREHLELFAELRGFDAADSQPRIARLLEGLELPDDGITTASKFSGGMKRRLSVGNALSGKNTLIILDEPSSGLDPLSRRKLWQIVKNEKDEGHTVLLSTHFMEEADYLGDRIGIMSKGRMYCCGTSQELKQQFACGFFLRLVKKDEECNVQQAEELIKRFVPEGKLESQSSGDVTFTLPTSSMGKFEALLNTLEERKAVLGIHGYGLSMNSLEDVFVAISNKEEDLGSSYTAADGRLPFITETITVTNPNAQDDPQMSLLGGPQDLESRVVAAQNLSALKRMWHQVVTLLMRRLYIFARNRTLQVFFLLVPALFIIIAFSTAARQSQVQSKQAQRGPPQANTFDHVEVDFSDLNLIFIDLVDNALSRELANNMTAVYPTLFAGSAARVLRFTRLTKVIDYLLGTFITTSTVAYNQLAVAGPSGFQVQAGATPNDLNVTVIVNPSTGAANTAMLSLLLSAARGGTVRLPPVVLHDLPDQSGDNQTLVTPPVLYDTLVLQMYAMIATVLVISYSVVSVADEFSRRIYYNLRVSGMMPSAYWVSNLLHDLIWCVLPFLVIVFGVYTKPMDQLKGSEALFVLVLGYFLFACHLSLQCFCLALWRDAMKPVSYVLMMEVFTLVCAAGPYIFKLVLSSTNAISDDTLNDIWPYIRALTPSSCFFNTFGNIAGTGVDTPATFDDMWTLSNTDRGVGLLFLFSVLELAVPIAVLVAFSMDIRIGRHGASGALGARPPPASEDVDVAKERQRVTERAGDDVLRIQNVVQVYPEKRKVAVNGVCYGIKAGECFGLLGPNGAGKSTLVKMLMGELPCTEGTIEYADGKSNLEYRTARLGICQQNDALWDYLTAREHMRVYLRLRLTSLYHEGDDFSHITEALEKVHLGDDSEKTVLGFSGGMKRKLSVALAMFTGAQTVFLDEPSTGMDPFARRALWKVIHEALTKKHALILTTHSMEEADSVCGRISIITEGSLKCIGNSQHLKSRFGGGYVLNITLTEGFKGSVEDIDAVIRNAFPGSVLVEGLGIQRKYSLGAVASLAKVFGTMEKQKGNWNVSHYTIGQTSSLEQIFLRFVGYENN